MLISRLFSVLSSPDAWGRVRARQEGGSSGSSLQHRAGIHSLHLQLVCSKRAGQDRHKCHVRTQTERARNFQRSALSLRLLLRRLH